MILVAEMLDGKRLPIAMSETLAPFAAIRNLIENTRSVKRLLCDRETRHWMDVHAIRSQDTVFGLGPCKVIDGDFVGFFDGVIPIEVTDDMIIL